MRLRVRSLAHFKFMNAKLQLLHMKSGQHYKKKKVIVFHNMQYPKTKNINKPGSHKHHRHLGDILIVVETFVQSPKANVEKHLLI